jgi:hypothetical protein
MQGEARIAAGEAFARSRPFDRALDLGDTQTAARRREHHYGVTAPS